LHHADVVNLGGIDNKNAAGSQRIRMAGAIFRQGCAGMKA